MKKREKKRKKQVPQRQLNIFLSRIIFSFFFFAQPILFGVCVCLFFFYGDGYLFMEGTYLFMESTYLFFFIGGGPTFLLLHTTCCQHAKLFIIDCHDNGVPCHDINHYDTKIF